MNAHNEIKTYSVDDFFNVKDRLSKSEVGEQIISALRKTEGFTVQMDIGDRVGQFVGGMRNLVALNPLAMENLGRISIYLSAHEGAHAKQSQIGVPFQGDKTDAFEQVERLEPAALTAFNAVIEADATAKGMTAFIKSSPSDEEIRDVRKALVPTMAGNFSSMDFKAEAKKAEAVLLETFFRQSVSKSIQNAQKNGIALDFENETVQKYAKKVTVDPIYGNGFSDRTDVFVRAQPTGPLFQKNKVRI